MVPAKVEKVDRHGNKILEVIWDHLHESSLTDLLTHFTQRDETIEKQKRSATRDLHSAIDNNPNAMGCATQFSVEFMADEPMAKIEEQIVVSAPSASMPFDQDGIDGTRASEEIAQTLPHGRATPHASDLPSVPAQPF